MQSDRVVSNCGGPAYHTHIHTPLITFWISDSSLAQAH
jgi:hypothetical protein